MTRAGVWPEFSLLIECCRWNFANAGGEARPQISTTINWERFVHLARRHRVQGLAWNALAQQAEQLSHEARETLSSDARAIAATNLGIAGECRELLQDFDRAKVPMLFIKGLGIGALVYRSPLLKMGWDIDLLVDSDNLSVAAKLLSKRGYKLRIPTDIANLQSWHSKNKESVWSCDDRFHVELHTRLADNRRLIPGIDAHSPRQLVGVAPAISLPTLANDELFAYLAVHGAWSAWFRLKWISDFAALLHGRTAEEIEWLYHRSQELGAARAAGQAFLLADALFDVLEPVPRLRDRLESDRANRQLCRAALRIMTDSEREPTDMLLGTLPIHWTQFFLAPGVGYKISELRRKAGLVMKRLR